MDSTPCVPCASRHGPHASIGGARERVCHAVSAFDAGGPPLRLRSARVSSRGCDSVNRARGGAPPDFNGRGRERGPRESDLGVPSRGHRRQRVRFRPNPRCRSAVVDRRLVVRERRRCVLLNGAVPERQRLRLRLVTSL